MSKPRTAEELRNDLIAHLRSIAAYWAAQEGKTTQEKLDGAMFSALATLDGCSPGIPAFDLVARPHPGDKEHAIKNGQDWIEDGEVISYIMLHECYYETAGE